MPDLWELPGYDVLELLGFGATGEVWRARETATGEAVALKRLRPGADPEAVEALRREATLLRSLDTPYVVRLRTVLGEGRGTVLVLDHAAGGSLATLLAARGRLAPGEVVTVAVPLAEALATAHAAGLVHGDVSPANVLFTADGMPLLADLGVARLAGPSLAAVDGTAEYVDPEVARGATPSPAADVWALAAVCHHLLAGTPPHEGLEAAAVLGAAAAGERAPLGLLAPDVPRPLVTAVEAALVVPASSRPSAAGFAAALRRAHSPAPVRLVGSGEGARDEACRPTHRVRDAVPEPAAAEGAGRRPVPPWLPVAALGLAVLGAAAGLGWQLGRGASAPAAALAPLGSGPAGVPATPGTRRTAGPSPAAQSPAALSPAGPGLRASPDWARILDALDAARERALAAADPGLLAAVDAPGSPALRADTALVARLAAAGRTAQGVRHDLRGVRQLAWDGTTGRLQVRDVLRPSVVRGPGDTTESRSGRAEAAFDVVLVSTPAGLRLREVAAR